MRRALWPLVAAVVLVGVMFVAVFPVRTYLAQRRSLEGTERRVALLSEQNRRLAERVEVLHSDPEIERLAREQYNLVKPGEEAFAILPPRPVPRPADEHRADGKDEQAEKGWWGRLWHTVTGWF